MNLTKREFMQVIGAGSMAGLNMQAYAQADVGVAAKGLYDIPKFGQVSFLHMTDCHAQLKPIYFREPSVNLGLGSMKGQLPHLVGEHLLKVAGVRPGTAQAHEAVQAALVEDGHHARVGQACRGPCLTAEARDEVGGVGQVGVHELERHGPVQATVMSAVDGGHPATR